MTWPNIEAHWREVRRKAQRAWPKLSDADLRVIRGRRSSLIYHVQNLHGLKPEVAEREVDTWAKSLADPVRESA